MKTAALAFLILLAGCGGTRSATTKAETQRVQNVANATSGIDALSASAAGQVPALAEILKGARAFIVAAAGKLTVPPPAITPQAVIANPTAYRKAGEKAEREAQGTQWTFALYVGLSLAVPVLIALAKNLGGPFGGVAGGIANAVWTTFAPAKTKEQDEAAQDLVDNIHHVASAIPPDAMRALPPKALDAVAAFVPWAGIIGSKVPMPDPTPVSVPP